jgi:ABC-type Mn2+/Zn2+ transport system permease subunit
MSAALQSPFDLFELPFLRAALAELLLLAVAGGVLGGWIVLRRLAFFSHGVGAASFPGLVTAEAAGASPKLAGLAVAFAYAGGVNRAGASGRAARVPGDAATGLLLVAALAGGVVLASDVFHSGAAVDRLLFGTVLAVGSDDLALAAVAAACACAGAALLGRAWSASGFDPEGATALGVPARADLALLGLIALAAVAAIPAVGALLLTAMLVVPAATARLLTADVPGLLRVAVCLAAAEGVVGLYLAYTLDVPPGPAVAALGAAGYAVVAVTQWRPS